MRKRRILFEKIAVFIAGLIVLFAMLLAVGLVDPVATFKDRGLERAVRAKLDNQDMNIHKSDLLTITEIDASGRNIESLQGIEQLRKLVKLDLEDNYVKDLSPLAELGSLTGLSLRKNEITDLEDINFAAIVNLPLRKLSLRHNVLQTEGGAQFRLSDISQLKDLTSLEELELRDNHIADITPLGSLEELRILDLRENYIEDISALSNLDALEELNLRENQLACLEALSSLRGLTYLNIHSNKAIESLDPLRSLVNLETLIMRNVPVSDQVDIFRNLASLQRLNVRSCEINEISVFVELMAGGALQDDPDQGIKAEINLLDNYLLENDQEIYEDFARYWGNINDRAPQSTPALVGTIDSPEFSRQSGFYENEFFLELTIDDPEAKIYYTLDGSEPCPDNTDGSVYAYKNQYPFLPDTPPGDLLERQYITHAYKEPIYIREGSVGLDSIVSINATLHKQPYVPRGEVKSGTVVRAIAHKGGFRPSPVVTGSFYVGEGLNNYYSLPVVSVVTVEPNLFDYDHGIYVAGRYFDQWREDNPDEQVQSHSAANYHQRGREWEKTANLELFDQDGQILINQLSGLRVHGGVTRTLNNKSLRFYAREDYKDDIFNVRLFQTKDTDRFKRFILRNSGNDHRLTRFRDVLMQDLIRGLNLDQQASQPAVLFINGVYWGLFNIRDRLDRYYLHYEHGVDPYNLDILTMGAHHDDQGVLQEFVMTIDEGDDLHYQNMLTLIEEKDLSSPAVYEQLKQQMDIENFVDYITAQIYFANTDWPHNNLDLWRLKTDQYKPDAPYGHDGRWRWILYDTDFGFGHPKAENLDFINFIEYLTEVDNNGFFLEQLLENKTFQRLFINRMADHLNSIFQEELVLARIEHFKDKLAPLMQEHIDRWGRPGSIKAWYDHIDVLQDFARKRPQHVRENYLDYFDLNGTVEIKVNADYRKGNIIINSVNTGQSLSGPLENGSWQGLYFKDIPVTITAKPKPGYSFSGWEEVEEGESFTFKPVQDMTLTAVFER